MAVAIHFRDAVSLAGQFPLLAGVSLDVAEGRVAYVRGPNGAGKTSLLRACAGLVPVTSGEAVVLGHDLAGDLRPLRREIGLLGHANFLYEELNVEDNVTFALRAARADLSRRDDALDRLEISERLRKTRVARLSTGQARRVALAILVARAPRLWLLDEPHAGLDDVGRRIVDELVLDVRAQGSTVLLASHEAERASALADQIVEIDGGFIASGPRALATRRDSATDVA
jgi:ABC-type multidrug transport system ATPase subunit